MAYLEFSDSTFHGFGDCVSRGDPGELCLGTDGKQVLRGLHDLYDVIDAKNTFAEDLGTLMAIAAFWRVGYCFLVLTKSRAASTVLSTPATRK